ncbi:hypothetical protein E4198_03295 [Streptomyces sp. RKND-216]|uniref:hypothetical protein n=1 Tax=Streptomyces sp. RKND-216 TaxID=2562581 RepID=UPI00109DF8AB|nr:hypothetical protein [Streptomyces sp. RKND-216]THA23884.1 hypothetical protein E4198_03295 [Streptomyces sp. RKND-216]
MGDLLPIIGSTHRWVSRFLGTAIVIFALFFIWLTANTAAAVIWHVGTQGEASIEYCGGAGTRNDPYVCRGTVTEEDGRVLGSYSNRREENLRVGDTLVVWDSPAGWIRENKWTKGFSVIMASVGLVLLGLGITMAGPRSNPPQGSALPPRLRTTMPLKILGGLGVFGVMAGIILMAGV